MSWLVSQLWPLLALAAALGAVCTALLMTTRVRVERWVRQEPVAPRPFPVLGAGAAASAPPVREEALVVAAGSSPFPPLAGHGPDERPWEAEELWSRPARLAVGSGRRRTSSDEWSKAAASWRSWADEATGRAYVDPGAPVDDDDLFAADREAERREGQCAVLPDRFGGTPSDEVAEDDFPYARPVEANG